MEIVEIVWEGIGEKCYTWLAKERGKTVTFGHPRMARNGTIIVKAANRKFENIKNIDVQNFRKSDKRKEIQQLLDNKGTVSQEQFLSLRIKHDQNLHELVKVVNAKGSIGYKLIAFKLKRNKLKNIY